MITLYNVIDIRTEKFHSVVKTNKRNAKWFAPAQEWSGEEE